MTPICIARAFQVLPHAAPSPYGICVFGRAATPYHTAGNGRASQQVQVTNVRWVITGHVLNDNAVVHFAVAMADTGLEHRRVYGKKRQLLAEFAGLIEHQMRVFECLADPALRSKIARHHLRSLGIHDLRRGCGRAGHFEKGRRVETKARGENEPLGESKTIKSENKIDGELGAAAIADLSDVEALGEQRLQYRCGDLRDSYIAADETNAVALPHLCARARYRYLEETKMRRHPPAERGNTVGIAGAGADDDLAGGRRYQRAFEHLLDLVG